MKTHDDFDDLLHEALSEYRDAEPLAGIESRILARLQLSEPSRRPFVLRWAIALACAAAIAAAIWFGSVRRTPESVSQTKIAATPSVAQAPIPRPAPVGAASGAKVAEFRRPAKPHAVVAAPVATVAHAVPSVFPLPSPLTAQEQAFLASVQGEPDSARLATAADDALVIAKIEIKPLERSGTPSGDNP